MTNNRQLTRWTQAMEAGKKALNEGRCVEATRHFTLAVQHASVFGGIDILRGVALSWSAVGYYKMSTFSLAEAFFKESMDILDMNLSCEYSAEIACNLKSLVAIYSMQGRTIEALQVSHVIRRHLLESGFEGSLTMSLEPPPAKQRADRRLPAQEAATGLARVFQARKLKSMNVAQPTLTDRIRLAFAPNGKVNR